jgi:hypothetical protein
MRARCENPRNHKFSSYGARGIYVAPQLQTWGGFWAFIQTLPGWSAIERNKKSLDREDNDGPYTPENLRLASPLEQRVNQRRKCRQPPAVKAGDREGEWTATGRFELRSRPNRGLSKIPSSQRYFEYRCKCGNLRYYVRNYIRWAGIRHCNACTGRRGATVRWGKS